MMLINEHCCCCCNIGSEAIAHASKFGPSPFDFGVRQGSVLSPFIFALYVDNLANLWCSKTVVYTDDRLVCKGQRRRH